MKQFTFLFFCMIISSYPLRSQVFISEYSEGSSYNKYLEIYNYSSETVNLYPQFVLASCTNGCVDGNNFFINEFPEDAVILPGDVYVVAATQADQAILNESDYTFQYCCGNGDDAYALMLSGTTGDVFDSSNALDIVGSEQSWQEGIGWDVAGIEEATKNHTLVRKSSVATNNAGNWTMSAGTNSSDSEWIVLDIDDWSNLGFHDYDNNNSNDIFGCMCEEANNYDPTATQDDGSCVVDLGCSDDLALNYSGDLCLAVSSFINEDCQYETVDISGCYDDESIACNGFDFDYMITSVNMTLAIVDISNLILGDIIGVFYLDQDGLINCGGSIGFEGDPVALAAWGDDSSTILTDGFQTNSQFIFFVLRDGIVYETTTVLNNLSPFSNTWVANGFGQITSLSLANEFLQDCIFPPLGYDCNGNILDVEENVFRGKEIIKSIDFLGRSVNKENVNKFKISIFNDGTFEKSYNLNH